MLLKKRIIFLRKYPSLENNGWFEILYPKLAIIILENFCHILKNTDA